MQGETQQAKVSHDMGRAVLYARFSPRPNANECDSVEKQLEVCGKYCIERKYRILGHTFDKAVSGKQFIRPGLERAIGSLLPGSVLVVATPRRLARDLLVSLTIRARVAAIGSRIEYADGSHGDGSPEGTLFVNIMAAFAQYDRERFAARTKKGLARKKAKGEYCGRVPYGWTIDESSKKLVKNHEEQDLLHAIKRIHQSGEYSASGIAALLNCERKLFRGKPWNERTIRRILRRESRES